MYEFKVLSVPSGRMYQVEQTDKHYVFLYAGNDVVGMRKERITPYPMPLTDDAIRFARPKDLWIEKQAVAVCGLTMGRSDFTKRASCASLKIQTTNGKTRRFIILDTYAERDLRERFHPTESAEGPGTDAARAARLAYGKTIASERDESRHGVYAWLLAACWSLSVFPSLASCFFPARTGCGLRSACRRLRSRWRWCYAAPHGIRCAIPAPSRAEITVSGC